jgi:hypothetical protein
MGHTPFPPQAKGFPRTPPSWEGSAKDSVVPATIADFMETLALKASQILEGQGLGGDGGMDAARKAEEVMDLTKLPETGSLEATQPATPAAAGPGDLEDEIKMYEDALNANKLHSKGNQNTKQTHMHMVSHRQSM